jgi:hypothetical protein
MCGDAPVEDKRATVFRSLKTYMRRTEPTYLTTRLDDTDAIKKWRALKTVHPRTERFPGPEPLSRADRFPVSRDAPDVGVRCANEHTAHSNYHRRRRRSDANSAQRYLTLWCRDDEQHTEHGIREPDRYRLTAGIPTTPV